MFPSDGGKWLSTHRLWNRIHIYATTPVWLIYIHLIRSTTCLLDLVVRWIKYGPVWEHLLRNVERWSSLTLYARPEFLHHFTDLRAPNLRFLDITQPCNTAITSIFSGGIPRLSSLQIPVACYSISLRSLTTLKIHASPEMFIDLSQILTRTSSLVNLILEGDVFHPTHILCPAYVPSLKFLQFIGDDHPGQDRHISTTFKAFIAPALESICFSFIHRNALRELVDPPEEDVPLASRFPLLRSITYINYGLPPVEFVQHFSSVAEITLGIICYTDGVLFDDPTLWPVLQRVTIEDFDPENEELLRRLVHSRSIGKICFTFIEALVLSDFESLSWLHSYVPSVEVIKYDRTSFRSNPRYRVD